MDFSLNEEQRHWQMEARKFSDEELRPRSIERDQIEGGFEPWDWNIIEKGSKLGFRTLASRHRRRYRVQGLPRACRPPARQGGSEPLRRRRGDGALRARDGGDQSRPGPRRL